MANSLEDKVTELEKTIAELVAISRELRTNIAHGFTKVDENFVKVNDRLDTLQGDTTKGFKKVDVKLDTLHDEITKINDVTSYEHLYQNMKIVGK
jgi:hypothetical protein